MAESFAQLFEQSILNTRMGSGTIINAVIISIDKDNVVLDAGLKSEGVIPVSEFWNEKKELEISVGDTVEVALEQIEDGFGETMLSREKAKRAESWRRLEKAYNDGITVTGIIADKVKGGFTVEIDKVRAFLPGSLLDSRPVREQGFMEGKEIEVKIIKMDAKRNNIVVSRRALAQAESSAEREALLENMHEGQEIKGIVKNLTEYGAFIDLGGIDGLLHVTDISWKRVKHPSEILTVGQEIQVKVLRFDKERNRVSLGMKQLGDDPWAAIAGRYPVGTRIKGKVTNVTDYGCFVEVQTGVEGLVHMSEMDWTNKNIHPSKVVALGDEVEVIVLEIDEERRRISLGMKQCAENPWNQFAREHGKGEKISGKIRSITDFGIFIGLNGNIDGLVHLSDISWHETGEEAIRNYKKGQDVEAIILAIDPERERISLGIKQMESDPFNNYADTNVKGTIVTGTVEEVDAKNAKVKLAEEVYGTLRSTEASVDKVDDLRSILNEGDSIEAKIINVDKKNRTISLSVKAKDVADEADAIKRYTRSDESEARTSLGDLLKEKMSPSDNSDEAGQ